jgi:hypothetical protein
VHGEQGAGQVVRWQLQRDTRHLLIASIDAADVDAVLQQAAQYRLRVRSLQPAFCAHWNQHGRALPRGLAVFATLDDGHLTMACVRRGSIMALSCGPCNTVSAPIQGDERPRSVIDERVDRLLAGSGINPADMAAFMLVAREGAPTGPLRARWTDIQPAGDLA